MQKGRLEAFSDGVLAIIITIMVLELKVPHGEELTDLLPLVPVFISYILSFIYIGIYWNNHHHLFQAVQKVNGAVLWSNLNLLFWLSLVPFATSWMGENHFGPRPVAVYGTILFMAGVSYFILVKNLVSSHGSESTLKKAVGSDRKGKASILIYGVAIAASFLSSYLAFALYVVVAAVWFIPDRRFEKKVTS
jgi:uncharacterized membrane protein